MQHVLENTYVRNSYKVDYDSKAINTYCDHVVDLQVGVTLSKHRQKPTRQRKR